MQNARFRSDLARAQKEVAKAMRAGKAPQNCKGETLALAAR
jgi:hypothetical protein